MKRRDLLKSAAMVPLALPPIAHADGIRALSHAMAALEQQAAGKAYTPKYFSAGEWKTVRVLVDLIIPKDGRSGSATDVAVPEYMDFICTAYPSYAWTRDALKWLDGFATRTHGKSFVGCTDAQRRSLLDQIAWPKKATPELAQGVTFFNRWRDFTASGFFSSQMGVQDLQYVGNVALPEWTGCPKPVLDKIGVSYALMNRRGGATRR